MLKVIERHGRQINRIQGSVLEGDGSEQRGLGVRVTP